MKTFEEWWNKTTYQSLASDPTSRAVDEAIFEGIAREAWSSGVEAARVRVLEQRCERLTPWDLAVNTCGAAVKALKEGKSYPYPRVVVLSK